MPERGSSRRRRKSPTAQNDLRIPSLARGTAESASGPTDPGIPQSPMLRRQGEVGAPALEGGILRAGLLAMSPACPVLVLHARLARLRGH